MVKKNRKINDVVFKKIVLACFIIMLAFSVLNIGRVLAGVDKINVTNAIISDKSSTTEASITNFSNDKVVTDVKYHNVNEYVEFTVTLKNNDSQKYTIKTITDNNADSYITYDYDKHENEELLSQAEKDIVIKATYTTEVTNINERKANVNVEFKITFIEEDGSESDKTIIINPTTGDNLWIYVALGILSLSGLLVTLKFKKINKSLLILLLMTPFLVKAASLTYEFNFISVIGYYDKILVTIDRNGTKEQVIVPYGTKMTEPTTVAIPGYNFIGFYIDGELADFNEDITEDTLIEARYSIINYNITYDLAGGTPTGFNPTTYTVDDEFTLSNPTLVGYNFSGWTGTNLSGLTPTVTIHKGTTEDLSFTANFSAATNTKYTVYHKYQQVTEDLYDTVEENGTGTTGTTIYPQIKPKTGFMDPTVQALEILPDGTASIDYVYNRVPCNYEADSNTNSSLVNGTYRYGTEITVSPKDVQGYTFTTWEDGSSDNPRTITLTGNTSVSPSYSPNTNTPYTVTHRYQKVTLDGYDEEYVTGHGTTGTTITAPMQTRTGFTTPASTTVEIKGDGSGSATYTYDRLMFNFSVTDRTYLTPESDANSSYPYGKQISVTAVERPGYDFEWLDGETSYTRNITIDSDVELTPVYIAKTDTPYTVKHYKMDVNGTSYTIADTVPGTGTTDSSITPATNTYEGFTAPATQTTTISGTGNTVVEYYYTRNQYNLTIINSQFVEQDKSGPHYYEEQVTLTAINREGYHFVGWSTGGGASTVIITIPVGGITTEPLYSASTDTTYSVKHRYRKLTVAEEYDEVTIDGTGTTGDVIPAPLNPRTGFVNPPVQNITITPDGNAQVTYTYQRDQYAFTITDRTYLDSNSTANGTYPYETPITLKAIAREGYTFKWSDNVTDLERSFNLTSAITLSLDYTANTYNVYFDKNDTLATGTMVDQEFEYDMPENLDSNLFVKTGYTFSGWNTQADGLGTTYANEAEVTNLATSGTVNLYAMWTPNTNTAYKVIHKKQKVTLDGYDEIVENLTGTSDTSVTPTVNNYTGFTTPTAQTVTISRLGDTVVTYVYDREIYTISFNTDGGSTEPAQVIAHGGTVTRPSTDPTKANYTFDDWYTDNTYQTPFDFANTTITGPTTIYGKFDIDTYTVTFNTDGGSTEPAQVIAHGGTVTRPSSNPTKTGYNFINWYTDDTYQTPFDFTNTTITGPTTIYAKFDINTYTVTFDVDGGESVSPITITRGQSISSLPTTTKEDYRFEGWYLDLSDSNPVSEPFTPTADVELKAKWQKMICKKATTLTSVECHSNNNIGCKREGYVDGNIVTFGNIVSSDTYSSGDALLCDVDGTGYNKRFYYMRTLNGNAVLIHDQLLVLENDAPGTNYIYNTAKTVLPDVTTWTNLPVKFENDTKAARFPTIDDTIAATGISKVTNIDALVGFNYLFENTGKYATTSGFDTVWLNEVINGATTSRYRYHNNSLSVSQIGSGSINTSKNCVKPVIEVPLDLIEDDYVVRFNANDGTNTNLYRRIKKGDALGTLPVVTKSGSIFDGWYTSSQYTTSIDENTVPNDYDIYYAKWVLDISNAVISDVSFTLGIGDEDDIEITSLDVEPVTYASNDDTVVTVDSNGHMVAIDEGTTTIIITGSRTGHVRTINVRVATVLSDCIVSFDSDGGSPVGNMTVPVNTALGSLPSPDPTKTDYVFSGWYTDTSYTTKVTVNTIIRSDVTFIAKWIPADAQCEMEGTYYNSLQTAVDTAGTSKTTITLVKDVTLSNFLDLDSKNTNKNIVLDLDGHTLSSNNGQTIKTKATLEIKNGTVTNGTANGAVDIGSGGHLIMNSGSITQTATGNYGRAAVYNNGGTVEIGGTAYLTSNAYWTSQGGRKRGTVQNVLGSMTITGGKIVNTRSSNSYAVSIEAGTVVIGTSDGAYDTTNLIIQGETGGIFSTLGYSLFDGLIKGKTSAVNDESKITGYESGSTKVNDNDGTYYILYYQMP